MMCTNCSGWMMGGMVLFWILLLVVLVLAIAGLVKYLRSGPRGS
jgi:hypothetical protein